MGRGVAVGAAFVFLLLVYLAACSLLLHSWETPAIQLPFGKSDEILAKFNDSCITDACPVLGEGFFFGLATAPAHVEDDLECSWVQFARDTKGVGKGSRVAAFHNHAVPEDRLRFWSDMDTELDLVSATGVTAFRMGLDWGRLVPEEPAAGTRAVLSLPAVEQYRTMMRSVKSRGLKLMLTLFHHSSPKWAVAYGGWTDRRTVDYFVEFTQVAMEEFGSLVDYWCTFNEPTVYAVMTHCVGAWPPGRKPSNLQSLTCFLPTGAFGKSMAAIADAHNAAYRVLKKGSSAPVGVAHNVGVQRPFGLLDAPLVAFSNFVSAFGWTDAIEKHLDFLGLNYYGQEFLSSVGLQLSSSDEYSESGRGVYPDGLYRLLLAFHSRYSPRNPKLRYIVTENGISDARDVIRRPYLIEHLMAVKAAMEKGVPIDGYFWWTVSDNWEWSDGYCPKFGMVDVDRGNGLKRRPRPSYHLWTEIVTSRQITRQQREQHWGILSADAAQGGLRPFCRPVDYAGRMWSDSLDVPRMRHVSQKDWRFGHYEHPSTTLALQRSLKVLWTAGADLIRYPFSSPDRGGSKHAKEGHVENTEL